MPGPASAAKLARIYIELVYNYNKSKESKESKESKHNINAASCKLSGKDHTGSPAGGRQAPPIHHNRPKSELKCLSTRQDPDQASKMPCL